MEQSLEMLAAQQVDPEVFRRVWARVMPNQKDSPIVVVPPAEKRRQQPARPTAAPTRPKEPETQKEQAGEETLLKQLLEQLWEGSGRLQELHRRSGGRSRYMQALAADYRRTLRQLEVSWFLLTGRRDWRRPSLSFRNEPLAMGLRTQFLWERKWRDLCLRTGEETTDPVLGRLCRQLAEESILHAQLIRSMLEQGR